MRVLVEDMEKEGGEVTRGLRQWNEAPKAALDEVLPAVEAELRRLAASFLAGEAAGHTLQPTALVHELYLRLLERKRVDWQDRSHFFGFAARTMRRILVDHARAKRAEKRGGGIAPEPLATAAEVGIAPDLDLIALDQALSALGRSSRRQQRIVELHIFAGLTFGQVAELLGMGESTVRRHWVTARLWLYERMAG